MSFNVQNLHIPSDALNRVLPDLLLGLADGKLTTEEILDIVAKLAIPAVPIPSVPMPVPPALPPTFPTPEPKPEIEDRFLLPDGVSFEVTAIELGGDRGDLTPGDYTITDEGDHYELKLGPKSPTTNLPLHSRLDFALGYLKNGVAFKFEDQTPPALHLYYTSRMIAYTNNGKVSIGPGKGATMETSGDHIANWSPRWEQTGGMNPTLKIPAEADGQRLIVVVRVPVVDIEDKPLYLPVAS